MLAKPGEESGLYKRQSIHVKTGIVTGTGGVLKKAPPPQVVMQSCMACVCQIFSKGQATCMLICAWTGPAEGP